MLSLPPSSAYAEHGEDRARKTELAEDRQRVPDAAKCVVERDVHQLAVAGIAEQVAPGGSAVAARDELPHLSLEIGDPDRQRVVPAVGDRVIDEDEWAEESHGGPSRVVLERRSGDLARR